MSKRHKKHHKDHKSNNNHKAKNNKYITQKDPSLWQKFKKFLSTIIQFVKNLFSNKKQNEAQEESKNSQIVISDPNFLDRVENLIATNQSVTDLTTPLYSAYISDPDVARISKLVNGQIPVNEANLDFKNLLASEEVVHHLLKSNKVSPKIKEKVQEIKDKMDKKKQRLHAQPGFKSKPSDKPKPRF